MRGWGTLVGGVEQEFVDHVSVQGGRGGEGDVVAHVGDLGLVNDAVGAVSTTSGLQLGGLFEDRLVGDEGSKAPDDQPLDTAHGHLTANRDQEWGHVLRYGSEERRAEDLGGRHEVLVSEVVFLQPQVHVWEYLKEVDKKGLTRESFKERIYGVMSPRFSRELLDAVRGG